MTYDYRSNNMNIKGHPDGKTGRYRYRLAKMKGCVAYVCGTVLFYSIAVILAESDHRQRQEWHLLDLHHLHLYRQERRPVRVSRRDQALSSTSRTYQDHILRWPSSKALNVTSTAPLSKTMQGGALPISKRGNCTEHESNLLNESKSSLGSSSISFLRSFRNEKPSDINGDITSRVQCSTSDASHSTIQSHIGSSTQFTSTGQMQSTTPVFDAQDHDDSSIAEDEGDKYGLEEAQNGFESNPPNEISESNPADEGNSFLETKDDLNDYNYNRLDEGKWQASTKVYREKQLSIEDDEDLAEGEIYKNKALHKSSVSLERYYDEDNLDNVMEERQGIFARLRPKPSLEKPKDTRKSATDQRDGHGGRMLENNRGADDNASEEEQRSSQLQLVYRYFGKSSTGGARSRIRNKIPFIVLSPDVAYWKKTGTILSAKGYSVIACETSIPGMSSSHTKRDKQHKKRSLENVEDGAKIVNTVLNTLNWKRAIVVGNDGAGAEALQAAMGLGPDRVAGLILCGDLRRVNSYAEDLKNKLEEKKPLAIPSVSLPAPASNKAVALAGQKPALDDFLEKYLHDTCPSMIVWDGDLHTLPTFQKGARVKLPDYKLDQLHHRHLILGGGSSPHRRLPEQFSWVVSRFVEEHIAATTSTKGIEGNLSTADSLSTTTASDDPEMTTRRRARFGMFRHLWSFAHTNGELIGATVTGRIVAALILYVTAARVFTLHYYNVCCFLKGVRKHVQSISSWSIFMGAVSTKKNKLEEQIRVKGEKLRKREIRRKKNRSKQTVTEEENEVQISGPGDNESMKAADDDATTSNSSKKLSTSTPSNSNEKQEENSQKGTEERKKEPPWSHFEWSSIVC